MDYDALAKQFGGTPSAKPVDYDAIAKQFGGQQQAPAGMRPVQAGEIPTASGFYATPTPEVPRSFMQRVGGLAAAPLDVALTLGSAAARGVAAPIYGLATGRGEAGAREVLAGIRPPQTPEAAAMLEAAAPALSALPPIIGANVPVLPGTATQARTVAGRGVQAAKEATVGPMLERRAEARSAESYARAPQIDAARDAQRLGIVLNPTDIQPTIGPRALSAMAGARGAEKIVEVNRPAVNRVARLDMGMAPDAALNNTKSFDAARAAIAEPYNKIKQIPLIQADEVALKALDDLRPSETLIGGAAAAGKINALIDSAVKQMSGGMSGAAFLDNISKLRKDARRIYNNKNADPVQLDLADTNMAIANILEQGADRSVFDPKLLKEYQAARAKMARIYAYQAATDLNTGLVDPNKIARITAKDNALTGDLAALGRIAGNFPDAFGVNPAAPWYTAKATRSGLAGAAGALAGAPFGLTGSILGGTIGGLAGEFGSQFAANRLASAAYQAGLTVPDYRLPRNQLVQPIPRERAIVPYQTPIEVLPPGAGPYRPNFVMQGNEYPPRATFVGPEAGPPQLPAPSAESTMATLRAEDARRAAMSRALGQEAEARQAAVEAARRRPTAGEVVLELDPVTGRLREASQGIKGATPETFRNFGADLESAAQKVSAGKRFDLTAAEKVAWERTKVDLAEVAPGMKSLSDKAVAEKMLDRAWVSDAIKKAREKAEAFAQIEAKAKDAAAKRKAAADRERMLDLLESLEEQFRMARPVQGTGQGPKTRAAQRNQLRPAEPVNKLILPD
jgi:hypothetical protein